MNDEIRIQSERPHPVFRRRRASRLAPPKRDRAARRMEVHAGGEVFAGLPSPLALHYMARVEVARRRDGAVGTGDAEVLARALLAEGFDALVALAVRDLAPRAAAKVLMHALSECAEQFGVHDVADPDTNPFFLAYQVVYDVLDGSDFNKRADEASCVLKLGCLVGDALSGTTPVDLVAFEFTGTVAQLAGPLEGDGIIGAFAKAVFEAAGEARVFRGARGA